MLFAEEVKRWLSDPPPDQLFEISAFSLVGVSPRNPHQQRQEALVEAGLTASPSLPNVTKPQLYRNALDKVAGKSSARRRIALVIPDYAVRMAILDFEEFPANDHERIALLRFRLRKSVPFHIDEAQLAYAVQLEEKERTEVLVVAIAGPILKEYEEIFVDAGFRLGLVVPSLLAALPLCDNGSKGLTLLAKAAGATLSVVLLEQGRVRLVRCLDMTGEEYGARQYGEAVVPLLRQTLAFAEDQIGQPARRALLCGFDAETDMLGRTMEQDFGVRCEPMRSKFGLAFAENAGLLGLLEQYAA